MPYIAVPTTAGTGSEVTRNAVLGSPEHRVKASLRSAGMLARLAVVDPELTLGLPRPVTASTGLDALTQLIEPYVSSRANPMTDLFCVEGIRRIADSPAARLGERRGPPGTLGYGLGQPAGRPVAGQRRAGSGARFRGAHRGHVPRPARRGVRGRAAARHGGQRRGPAPARAGIRALRRYEEIARLLTGRLAATIEDGLEWVAALCRRLEIPRCGAYGVGAGRRSGPGGKGGPGQQHESQPHRADCRGAEPHSGAGDLIESRGQAPRHAKPRRLLFVSFRWDGASKYSETEFRTSSGAAGSAPPAHFSKPSSL